MNLLLPCRRFRGPIPGIFTAIAVVMIMNTNLDAQESSSGKTWTIVIHGGAGGDPNEWDEAKAAARKAGLEKALKEGREVLAAGGDALDAVERTIRVMEDDAVFNAGRGAVLTTDGRAELDASIMDGKSAACGAVAGVTRPKNPISLARRVMEATPHVLLAGPGADEFAKQQEVPLVDPEYFLSRSDRYHNRDVAPISDHDGRQHDEPELHFGTVGCVAIDQRGNMAAGTSTGGTSKKLPGRIGDSPIVGAGTYAANGVCAVSGTGRGEEYIRHAVAYDVAAQMRYANQTLNQAVTEIMQNRLKPGDGGLIAVGADGSIVMQHNTPGMSCAAADHAGRMEIHLQLPGGGIESTEAP